ncbi:hypothetical protein FRC14_002381 [Serendipita sp. 396]|nr:hypothetical protein FRC14_002381 [Serendipita sp. 396]KAG8786628.1 hypothetical protein FRC15_011040 [Serendipita sp. 397]
MSAEYQSLRAELKQWEKEFQNNHSRKATPEDIKLVAGLPEKYKRFKVLSKASTKPDVATSSKSGVAAPASTSIIKHSQATENERDPLPQSARPNPFSPVKKPSQLDPSTTRRPSSSIPEFPAFPNLFSSPKKSKTTTGNTAPSPPTSPNPFMASSLAPPNPTVTSYSPQTAARKRMRGDEIWDPPLPEKKRRSMNRPSSTSYPGLFGAPSTYTTTNLFNNGNGGTASSLYSGSHRAGSISLTDTGGGDEEEVFEPSPVKPLIQNGAVYKPMFDDEDEEDDILPSVTAGPGKGTARTVSMPVTMSLFGKGKPLNKDGRSNSASELTQRDPGDEENEGMNLAEGSVPKLPRMSSQPLLAPTPIKGTNPKQWKGLGKQKKGQKYGAQLTVDDEEEEEGTTGSSEMEILEVGWKVKGPLKPSEARGSPGGSDDEDYDDDDTNFEPLPKPQLRWTSRHNQEETGDVELEAEQVEIDLPDEMREMLQLSPIKPRVDEDILAKDILSGFGDRTKRAEVWTAGDRDEREDSEEWDSEGVGWWEAEL